MYSYTRTTLSNGLPLVIIKIPYSHKVLITIFIKMGSAYENKKTNGLSHFLEHALLRGPKKYATSVEFKQALEDFGVALKAATFKEFTYFEVSCTPKYVEKALINLSEIFTTPRFNKKEIDREKQIIIEEILESQDTSGKVIDVDEIASSLLWPNHPLGLKIQGTVENVRRFRISDLRAHFQKFFKPKNVLLCVAGNISNEKKLKKLAQEHFSFLKGATDIKISRVSEPQETPQFSFVKNMAQAQVNAQLCFRALPYNHPQITALEILNKVLGEEESSRLAISLCEKQGLVYRISSVLSLFCIAGTLDINFSVSPGKLEKVLKEILAEIKKLKKFRISKRELSRAKMQLERDLEFSLDEPERLSEIFGLDALLTKIKTPEEKLDEIRKVTAQDVQSLAKKIFIPKNLNLIVVGPFTKKQEERSREILSKFAE